MKITLRHIFERLQDIGFLQYDYDLRAAFEERMRLTKEICALLELCPNAAFDSDDYEECEECDAHDAEIAEYEDALEAAETARNEAEAYLCELHGRIKEKLKRQHLIHESPDPLLMEIHSELAARYTPPEWIEPK